MVTCISSPEPEPSESLLTEIPPELLLRVLSFLPSTASFLSLSQASPSLRSFVSLHASKICNDFILSHFPVEASLLGSDLRDGWLVPTHPSVHIEETLFLARKRRACAACQERVRAHTPSLSLGSLRNSSRQASGHRQSCSGGHRAELQFALSSSGPLYLRFLEEYGREIRIRGELAGLIAPGDTGSSPSPINEREKEFAWQISTYAIRPYLRKLDALLGDDDRSSVKPSTTSSPVTSYPNKAKASLGQKLLGKFGLEKIAGVKRGARKKNKERMFGELFQESTESIIRVSTTPDEFWRNDTGVALLWYFGIGGMGVLGAPHTSSPEVAPFQRRRKGPRIKDRVKEVQKRAIIIGQRVYSDLAASERLMQTLIRRSCFGKMRGFQKLS